MFLPWVDSECDYMSVISTVSGQRCRVVQGSLQADSDELVAVTWAVHCSARQCDLRL